MIAIRALGRDDGPFRLRFEHWDGDVLTYVWEPSWKWLYAERAAEAAISWAQIAGAAYVTLEWRPLHASEVIQLPSVRRRLLVNAPTTPAALRRHGNAFLDRLARLRSRATVWNLDPEWVVNDLYPREELP